MLADIRVSRAQAKEQASRPFYQSRAKFRRGPKRTRLALGVGRQQT